MKKNKYTLDRNKKSIEFIDILCLVTIVALGIGCFVALGYGMSAHVDRQVEISHELH